MIRLAPPRMPADAVPALVRLVGRELASDLWRGSWWAAFWSGGVVFSLAWLGLLLVVLLAVVLILLANRGPR